MNFQTHYIVKPEEGVVVCIIHDCCCNAMALVNKHTGLFEGMPCQCNQSQYCLSEYRGVAKCSPEDTFNEEYGKKLAYKKAYVKYTAALERTVKRIVKDYTTIGDSLNTSLKKVGDKIDGRTNAAIESYERLLKEAE